MAVLHALVAAAPIVPAVLIAYLVTQHRLPAGRPMLIALAVAFVLCAAIALTLASRLGLRMLRFVTLIPVVLSVAAVLKLGTTAIDQKLSARPLAIELASVETHQLPLAVCGASREVEYGLAFYRNQVVARYEIGRRSGGRASAGGSDDVDGERRQSKRRDAASRFSDTMRRRAWIITGSPLRRAKAVADFLTVHALYSSEYASASSSGFGGVPGQRGVSVFESLIERLQIQLAEARRN